VSTPIQSKIQTLTNHTTVIVYPALQKANIDFNPVRRITLGFFCASFSMVYACVLQHYIYKSPPASINVWIQAPGYIFGSLSEIWVLVTGIEIAFNNSPENLRAVVTSVFWVTIAVGAAIGIALTPVSQNPYMVWTYGGIAVAAFLAGCVFWFCFRDGGRKESVIDGVDFGGQVERESTKDGGEVNVKTQKL
jgi:POT family proton-dependent oligopeptide transporter